MKLKIYLLGLVAMCAAVFMPIQSAHAQSDSALLDALVKKGVLSDQEAEDVRASETKDYAMTAASKINLGSSIKSITFYGDMRLRFEMRDGTVNTGDINNAGAIYGHNDSQTRDRWRYRLRFGVKGDLYDNFSYGIRLATNPNYDRSGNVTFGDTDSGGPFGKAKSILTVDQVFLSWKPTSYLTFTGGKMPNPFYTTNLVWDDNLNPEGAAEQFDKTMDNFEVFANLGQFVYGDSADNAGFPTGGQNFSDIFLFSEQLGFKYKFNDDTFFKMGVTMNTYSGTANGDEPGGTVPGLYSTAPYNLAAPNNSPSFFTGPFVGAAPAPVANNTGINDLAVIEVPMEFDFKIGPGVHTVGSGDPKDIVEKQVGWELPMRIFGDFAYNFEASERADAARSAIFVGANNTGVSNGAGAGLTTAQLNSQNFQGVLTSGKGLLDQAAYQVGIEAGQLKKKGDWDGKLYWQSTGYYAVDTNLNDADIFNAASNMQGAVVSIAHNWTDGFTSTLRYAYATRVNDKMATPNVNQDLQINPINQYNLFQADLMWKF